MNNRTKRIAQVGMLVSDLEKAIEKYEQFFGITGWERFDMSKIPVDLMINGEPGKLNIRGAVAKVPEGLELEVIEPTGEGPFMDHLRNHGPGVHHFAIIMPDKNAEFQKVMDEAAAEGNKPWVHVWLPDAPEDMKMDFAYLDMRRDMGAIIEIYNEPKE